MKRIARITKKKEIIVFQNFNDLEIDEIEKEHSQIEELYRHNLNIQNITYCQNQINQIENTGDLLRLINEYLNLTKTFLFHWESLIKKKFGKNTLQADNFQKATSNEYDNFLSYKFLYELRNYIQHCKFPEMKTNAKINNDGTISRKIIIERESLDEDFKWNKFSNLERENLENIDLIGMINENVMSLFRIHNSSLNDYFNIEKLFESTKSLMKYQNHVSENENFAVIEYQNFNNGNFDGINLLIIDFNKIKVLQEMISAK